jgi:hypothetical protein
MGYFRFSTSCDALQENDDLQVAKGPQKVLKTVNKMVAGKFIGGQNRQKVVGQNLLATLTLTNSCCSFVQV